MRVLCTCLPGYGHFLPMLPFARAAAAAGHEVAFGTAADFCPAIERAGFPTFPAGMKLSDQLAEAARRYPEQASLPHGLERFFTFVPRMLAGVAAPPRADDLVPVVQRWRPDVLVHDETDFGGPVAAAVSNVPYADHSVGVLRPLQMARLAREIIAPLWDRWGVDLGEFGGLFRHLYLDVCPPSLQLPEIDAIDVAHPMQNAHIDAGEEHAPEWVQNLRPVPTVYISLGTIFNQNPGIFQTILEGLSGDDFEIIVTVGAENDPAVVGPHGDNVHVERFVPQSLLLPHCDVVINQGGTAILPILADGLPMLLLPQGANQFFHADACLRAGVARMLRPAEISAEPVGRELRTLLHESEYRENAERVAAEIERMPGPADGVTLVEQLVREGRPLTREVVHT